MRWPVLTVSGVSAGRAPYFLADRADELVTLAGGVGLGPARWSGRAAADLGLAGPVDAAGFTDLLAGRRPGSARPLRGLRGHPVDVAAYDLTFAAPKSVSVLCALGAPATARAVVASHAAAVEAALGYVGERAAAVRRRVDGDRVSLATDGIAAACFTHGASRTGDPHLHTHAVVANLAHSGDGRWSALDGRGLHAHAGAAGALYRAHLRHHLGRSVGVHWRAGRRAHEVAGIDPLLIGAFSGRRADIERHLAERGMASATSRRVAATVTRAPKATADDRASLPGQWSSRARQVGWDGAALAVVTGRAAERCTGLDEWRLGAVLHRDDRPRYRRDVVEAWSEALGPGAPATEVEGSVSHWVERPGDAGVGERTVAPREVEAPAHLLRALGPRPASADGQQVWRTAARTLDAYRSRWGVQGPGEPLGVGDPAALAALPVRRLADHLATERAVSDARRRLGRAVGRDARDVSLAVER